MGRKRFIQEQIVTSLKGLDACVKTEEACRRRGRCTAAFYRWKERLADAMVLRVRGPFAAEDDRTSLPS